MPITYDEEWKPGSDKHSSVRQVYRDGKRLGRVRSWKAEDPGELTGEWFTVERWEKDLHVPQEGMHVDFQEALERVALYNTIQYNDNKHLYLQSWCLSIS